MGKEEFVAAKAAEIASLQQQAVVDGLGAAWDESALEQKASDGTLGQADLDKAVGDALAAAKLVSDQAMADAVAAAQAVDAQALADAKSASDAALASLQKALDDMIAKEQLEEAAVADVQAKVLAVQASFDAIKAILLPSVA